MTNLDPIPNFSSHFDVVVDLTLMLTLTVTKLIIVEHEHRDDDDALRHTAYSSNKLSNDFVALDTLATTAGFSLSNAALTLVCRSSDALASSQK